MYPVDSPAHGFLAVQLVAVVHVALALVSTATLWWLGMPIELSVPVFLTVSLALLKPFWPLYVERHPTHD